MQSTTTINQNHISLLVQLSIQMRRKKTFLVLSIMFVIGVAATVLGFIFLDEESIITSIGLFLFVSSLLYYPISLWTNKLITKSNKANRSAITDENKNTIEYFDDHFIVTFFSRNEKMGESKFYYAKLSKICLFKEHLFLFIAPNQAYIIAKDEVTNGTFGELVLFFKEKFNQNFKMF